MEFSQINTSKFDVNKPPKAYPTEEQDRDGNYNSSDVDYSKTGSLTSEQISDLHSRSDSDTSYTAQHHTLGPGRYQAAPGGHIHDGYNSPKLGKGLGLVLTGAKGGNVALTNLIAMLKTLIDFTDSTT